MPRSRFGPGKIILAIGAVCAIAFALVTVSAAAPPAQSGSVADAATTSPIVPHAIGRKEITCPYGYSNTDDFLVHPGAPGTSHEHDYFGAKGVTGNSTTATIRGHGTTCPQADDESGYWAPSLQIGGTTFRPTASHTYYERNTTKPVSEFPAGFHMLIGNAMSTANDTGNGHIYFGCAGSEDNRATTVTVSTCKSGSTNTFAIWLEFPNCWDGKQSTAPSLNLVYSEGSKATCPADHPVLLPSLHYTIWYDLPLAQKLTGVRLSSGPMGSSHADFVNGWAPAAMTAMVKCINTNNRDCP